MKKIILSLSILAFAGASTFVACKKSEVKTPISLVATSFQDDLLKINQKYQSKSNILLKTTDQKDADKKKKEASARNAATAGADAVAVVGVGATCSGWMVLGPIGGIAAGVFAGVSGAVASYTTYKGLGGMGLRPTGGAASEQAINLAITSHIGAYPVPNPHSNPWEFVGVRHNELVKALCSKTTLNPITSQYYLYDASDLTNSEIASLSLDSNLITAANYNFILAQPYPSDSMATLYPFINFAFSNDSTNHSIMTLFYTGLKQIENPQDVMPFINDYEYYFLHNPPVPTININPILAGLAVAKHSYALWSNALPSN